jgi:hypothetical protein
MVDIQAPDGGSNSADDSVFIEQAIAFLACTAARHERFAAGDISFGEALEASTQQLLDIIAVDEHACICGDCITCPRPSFCELCIRLEKNRRRTR